MYVEIASLRERLRQLHNSKLYMFYGIHPEFGKFCLIPNNYQTHLNIWLDRHRRYRFDANGSSFEYVVDDDIEYVCLDNVINSYKFGQCSVSLLNMVIGHVTMLHQILDFAICCTIMIPVGTRVISNVETMLNE